MAGEHEQSPERRGKGPHGTEEYTAGIDSLKVIPQEEQQRINTLYAFDELLKKFGKKQKRKNFSFYSPRGKQHKAYEVTPPVMISSSEDKVYRIAKYKMQYKSSEQGKPGELVDMYGLVEYDTRQERWVLKNYAYKSERGGLQVMTASEAKDLPTLATGVEEVLEQTREMGSLLAEKTTRKWHEKLTGRPALLLYPAVAIAAASQIHVGELHRTLFQGQNNHRSADISPRPESSDKQAAEKKEVWLGEMTLLPDPREHKACRDTATHTCGRVPTELVKPQKVVIRKTDGKNGTTGPDRQSYFAKGAKDNTTGTLKGLGADFAIDTKGQRYQFVKMFPKRKERSENNVGAKDAIVIELLSDAPDKRQVMTKKQYDALISLSLDLATRYSIPMGPEYFSGNKESNRKKPGFYGDYAISKEETGNPGAYLIRDFRARLREDKRAPASIKTDFFTPLPIPKEPNPVPSISRGLSTTPDVAITFQVTKKGNTSEATPAERQNIGKVLDTLEQHGKTATFFVPGTFIEDPKNLPLLRKMREDNHEIANYTYTMPNPQEKSFNPDSLQYQIRKTEILAGEKLGVTTRNLFRFPGLATYKQETVTKLGYTIVSKTGNCDSGDGTTAVPQAEVVKKLTSAECTVPGAIAIAYAYSKATAGGLDKVLTRLKSKNISATTVTEVTR